MAVSASPSRLRLSLRRTAPLLVLLTGLALTALVAARTYGTVEYRNQLRFRATTQQLANAIVARVDIYIALLRGGRGLLQDEALRQPRTFRSYVTALQLPTRYPGIQGIGWAQRTLPDERAALVQHLQAEWPGFEIWPEQTDQPAFPIRFLEPMDARNARAVGYDMYSEPVRRVAMDRAALTGRAAASARVTLVQETEQDPQSGFLIYLPLYRTAPPPDRPAELAVGPEADLLGFVYSPFRVGDLFSGVLGATTNPGLQIEVYDGAERSEEALLYRSTEAVAGSIAVYHRLLIAGREWTLVCSSTSGATDARTAAGWTVVIGLVLTLLLVALVRNLETARARSDHHAQELLLAAQQARHSDGRKQAILDAALDGVITTDRTGRIVEFNPAAERLFGRVRRDVVGAQAIDVLFPTRLRAEYTAGFAQHLETGAHQLAGRRIELTGQRSNQQEFPLEIAISRIDLDGELLFTAFLRDITERRAAEARIRDLHDSLERRVQQRTAELEDANRQLESFSYSVSHDLRAPARHVLGFAELLTRQLGPEADPGVQRLLRVITDSARRMAQLIDDLLTFARTSRQEFRRGPVNMNQLVAEAVRGLAPETTGRRIEWRISPLPSLEGDASLLAHVWTNLLSNAIKYTRPRAVAILTLEGRRGSDETTYQVRDNGTGFDMQYVHKLFGVFQRLHREEEFEGTGIGLANVARIIQRHGGQVWAEGAPDHGATFYFSIPHRPPEFIGPWRAPGSAAHRLPGPPEV